MAALSTAQGGHVIRYKPHASIDVFTVSGAITRQYAGGVDAPPLRAAQLTGTLLLRTELIGERWVVTGVCQELTGTDGSKPLSDSDLRRARLGKWVATVGGGCRYTWNNEPAVPSALNALLWPIPWRPLDAPDGVKIGDAIEQSFDLPLQSFLEDDPIGVQPITLRYVFRGESYLSKEPTWLFEIQADEQIRRQVKHPDREGLTLAGTVKASGSVRIRKADGRLDYARFTLDVRLTLEGEGLPFGVFSSATAVATAEYERKVAEGG